MINLKKYFLAVFLILFCLIIIVIPKENPEISYEYLTEGKTMRVYYVDDEQVVGILLPTINDNKYLMIEEAFTYLTSKANSTSYKSCVNLSTTLVSYRLQNDDIYLDVSDDFFRINQTEADLALAQILYTYQSLGYDNVFLMQNNQIIEQLGNSVLKDGIQDNLLVNYEVASSSMNNKTLRIDYEYANQNQTFINYLVDKDIDEVEFKINKIISFINREYETEIKLINFDYNNEKLNLMVEAKSEDLLILKNLLLKNLQLAIRIMEKT